jgi:hypothetical protein
MLIVTAGIVSVSLGVLQSGASATTPSPPFTQCPAIADDTSCALLIDITNSGTQILGDPTQGPFDGADDTLVGVINQSSTSVSSMPLSASTDIFGFDDDEICSGLYGTWGPAPATTTVSGDLGSAGCPYDGDTTTAAGPDTSFSGINSTDTSGTVNFPTPLAPGQSTYFSLEEALTPTSFATPTSVTTSLSGAGQFGPSITVPTGTAVTDSATLSGANAATATGTVTYDVYSDSACTVAVSTGTAENITAPGTLPNSSPVTLSTGTYYWQVSYSGDSANQPSTSICGSEVETVTANPDLNAVIQVETRPSFANDTVDISSSQLESSCTSVSYETLQGGSAVSPTVSFNSIRVVLDGDGNVTVVVNGVDCDPGKDLIQADLVEAPYKSATTNLVVEGNEVTPRGVTGTPADEVETGDTPKSGTSDVYSVFYVETNPVYAGQTAQISSSELFDRCGQGSRWESNAAGSPFIDSPGATATIDDDGNAVFVFKGASCAAGTSTVVADVDAGTDPTYTTEYVIDAPRPTLPTKKPCNPTSTTATGVNPITGTTAIMTMHPGTCIVSGTKAVVSGSGFQPRSIGALLECNRDPSEPTVLVLGSQIPVGCTYPLGNQGPGVVATTKTGLLPASDFTVLETPHGSAYPGPPCSPGTCPPTDSTGGNPTTDAKSYPCPPTAAQVAAGVTCGVVFSDNKGDLVADPISFNTTTSGPAMTVTASPNPLILVGG